MEQFSMTKQYPNRNRNVEMTIVSNTQGGILVTTELVNDNVQRGMEAETRLGMWTVSKPAPPFGSRAED